MKRIFINACVLFAAIGCSQIQPKPVETVEAYFTARDARNFSQIIEHVHDSLIITEGDYVMPYDHDSYYEVFKWDSVFQQSYDLVDVVERGEYIDASVKINSIKHEFLKNAQMTCNFRISLTGHKISKIESLDCPNADWGTWMQERDSLVSWISQNHPELDGFINDMTMTGAINYLRAIELYQADK